MARETNTERQLKELAAEFERLSRAALTVLTVVQIDPPYVRLATPSGIVSVAIPNKLKDKLKPGMAVRVMNDSMQIVTSTERLDAGTVHTIKRIDEKAGVIFVRANGDERMIHNGLEGVSVEEGDHVICDPSGLVAVKRVEGHEAQHQVSDQINVAWSDIVGNELAKQELQEAITLPLTSSSVLKAYGYTPPKGILLYGPPGCGKTMLAKAAATHIAKLGKGDAGGGFLYVKGPQLLDPYVGVTEAQIRELFSRARKYKQKHGCAAVLFIDEADALLGTRGDNSGNPLDKTTVPAFLAEMDGLEESGAMVLLATNRPDSLDPAVTREGRIDRKIGVARPTRSEAAQLVALLLAKVPVSRGTNIAQLSELAANELFSGKRQFAMLEFDNHMTAAFNLSDIVSGAMVATLVDMAKTAALRRDMAAGKTITGVTPADITAAVDALFEGNRNLDHREAMFGLIGDNQLINVRKIDYAEAA